MQITLYKLSAVTEPAVEETTLTITDDPRLAARRYHDSNWLAHGWSGVSLWVCRDAEKLDKATWTLLQSLEHESAGFNPS